MIYRKEIDLDNNEIVIEILNDNSMDENAMLLHGENSKDCILVDPGVGEDEILRVMKDNDFHIKYILITHAHFDHILCANNIRKKENCDIYVSKEDEGMMKDPHQNESDMVGVPTSIKDCKTFEDGEVLDMLGFKIKCVHTPGHTPGSYCFYLEDRKILISGDTLFEGSYGRTDFYGGDFDAIEHSLKDILFKLPDDVKVFPGHGASTSIGYEKENNMIFDI